MKYQKFLPYIVGGFLEALFYIALRLFAEGKFGNENVPLAILVFGPLIPLAIPFLFLALGRKQWAIGALAVAAITFVVSLALPIPK